MAKHHSSTLSAAASALDALGGKSLFREGARRFLRNRVALASLVFLVVLSLAVLYPPSEKLKGGIDLVGGSSLLFEL